MFQQIYKSYYCEIYSYVCTCAKQLMIFLGKKPQTKPEGRFKTSNIFSFAFVNTSVSEKRKIIFTLCLATGICDEII